MKNEELLLIKIKNNKKYNNWWIKLFEKKISGYLKDKMPSQTIGIFLNPYTSNKERIKILKTFNIL